MHNTWGALHMMFLDTGAQKKPGTAAPLSPPRVPADVDAARACAFTGLAEVRAAAAMRGMKGTDRPSESTTRQGAHAASSGPSASVSPVARVASAVASRPRPLRTTLSRRRVAASPSPTRTTVDTRYAASRWLPSAAVCCASNGACGSSSAPVVASATLTYSTWKRGSVASMAVPMRASSPARTGPPLALPAPPRTKASCSARRVR
mmetsp:Transcript_108455/g.301501  ORF Transcript_108455/g.301501 Transcript_108455/m.301501 type:complete len:206 (+) Transcript_108455:346-963(+)